MSAGFCNWVYRVDLPGMPPVVAKLFSPLAKLRLAPALRGRGDAHAGDEGLGPRLLFRSPDGLITDYVVGETLTEADLHEEASDLPARIAPRLAALHALGRDEGGGGGGGGGGAQQSAVLWQFLQRMVEHIATADDVEATLPAGISLAQLRDEVSRMRRRCDALRLPVVLGHGDLKPSNVMAEAEADGACRICFIDFELAGRHYRGYDLFKLFRTSGDMSRRNLRTFLMGYLGHDTSQREVLDADGGDAMATGGASAAGGAGAEAEAEALRLELDELQAETYAAEPLTWLEAAVFFLFAIRVYPAEAELWVPLARQRWESYLASAAAIDPDGEATRALEAARAARMACAGAPPGVA